MNLKKTFKERKLNKIFWGSAIVLSIVFPIYKLSNDSSSFYLETWLAVPLAFTIIALISKIFGYPKWCLKKDNKK